MSRKWFAVVGVVLVWMGLIDCPASAEVIIEESDASEASVVITSALEAFGIGTQSAHEIALLATAGILLQDEPTTCLVYLVTLHWCESVDGEIIHRRLRVRMDASCFDGGVAQCIDVDCGVGMKPMLKLLSSSNGCLGIPTGSCFFVELSGPVETTCDTYPGCECLPQLQTESCEDLVECVPFSPADGGGVIVPSTCPSCD